MTHPTPAISFGARLAQLAAQQPTAPALTLVHLDGTRTALTYVELHEWSSAAAIMLRDRGVDSASTVVVALGNSAEHFVATWAAWKLGALVLPMNVRTVPRERDAMLELAAPVAVVSDWDDVAGLDRADLHAVRGNSPGDLPDVTPDPGKCVGSGGSTGRPKIIVDPAPLAKVPGESLGSFATAIGFPKATIQLVPGPLFHNMPFTWAHHGLFEGQHLIVLERFDARLLVDIVEGERVEFMTVVPTMMRRVAELPGVEQRDFSSLRAVLHSAAACPQPLKRAWIDLVGPEILYEAFGATEAVGFTLIRGDEWLAHPGSVGRPQGTVLRIVGEDGQEVPPGEVGELFMRPESSAGETYRYVGAEPAKTTADGLVSVGDLGWVDPDGYLYPADRRLDLIITGGANVYPAEVEAVLGEHPLVADAVVIGLPDHEWGKRVHAIVAPYAGAARPTQADLAQWCRRSVAAYKVPKSFEVVDVLPRDEAGKLRRRSLVDARL